MLILTRKIGTSVLIGKEEPEIEVKFIHRITYDYIRLGITAPQVYRIWRNEYYDRLLKEGSHENI